MVVKILGKTVQAWKISHRIYFQMLSLAQYFNNPLIWLYVLTFLGGGLEMVQTWAYKYV